MRPCQNCPLVCDEPHYNAAKQVEVAATAANSLPPARGRRGQTPLRPLRWQYRFNRSPSPRRVSNTKVLADALVPKLSFKLYCVPWSSRREEGLFPFFGEVLGGPAVDPRNSIASFVESQSMRKKGNAMCALKRYRIPPDEMINSEKTPVNTN